MINIPLLEENAMVTVYRSYIQCDVPTLLAGRVFPREEVEQALADYEKNDYRVGCLISSPSEATIAIPFERVSHSIVSAFIDDEGYLCARIEPLDTPLGKIVNQTHIAGSKFDIVPIVTGFCDDETNYIVKSLTLHHFDLMPANIPRAEFFNE